MHDEAVREDDAVRADNVAGNLSDTNSLFSRDQEQSLALLDKFQREKINSFLIPTKFISPEAASVAFLMSAIYEKILLQKMNYKSFFSNSFVEAVHGAIKLFRHNQYSNGNANKNLLVISSTSVLENHLAVKTFNSSEPLIPSVDFIKISLLKEQNIQDIVANSSPAAILVTNDVMVHKGIFQQICEYIRAHNKIFMLEMTFPFNFDVSLHGCEPDIFLANESIVDYQIPLAVFSAKDEFYRPWNSLATCLLHSSTFSGNRYVLQYALSNLICFYKASGDFGEVKAVLNKIDENDNFCRKKFAEFVNPQLVKVYSNAGAYFRVLNIK